MSRIDLRYCPMNYDLLKRVVTELSDAITGAKVERVYQGVNCRFYFVVRTRSNSFILLLSPERTLPRMHLVSVKPPADPSPTGFILYLRSHLTGAIVNAVSILNEDRIAQIGFSRTGREYRVIFELFTASPAVVLTDQSLTILSVFPSGRSCGPGARRLLAGIKYKPPEKRMNAGMGTAEIIFFQPESYIEWPINRGLEISYDQSLSERHVLEHRTWISKLIKKALAKTARRIAAISDDLKSAEQSDEYREIGNLILMNGKRIKAGAEWADLADFEGMSKRVKLDSRKSPAQNAESYFRKYKKSKNGVAIIRERLDRARNEQSYLNNIMLSVETAESGRLDAIWSELEPIYSPKRHSKQREEIIPPSGAPFRKLSVDGWNILIGKSAAGNEYITFRLAAPDDLWLHAEGMPGSHVLIRNPRSADIPPEVLKKAAGLAAYFSKGRNAGKVPVTYTPVKFVKKPKGARQGTVILAQRQTIMIVPKGD